MLISPCPTPNPITSQRLQMNTTAPSAATFTNSTTSDTFVDTPAAWVIAALCSIVGSALALFTCNKHLRNYSHPEKQRNIVRILFIVPIYSAFSWFSLVFHKEALFFDTVRDIYEAYVIYCFLSLILAYGGGENQLCTAIARTPGSISHPPPLCKLPPMALGPDFLHSAKRYTLQFVIMKPVFGIFSLVMLGLNQYDQPWYQTLLFIVYNISYTLALYWLVLFYLATKHLPQLKSASPVFKFFAVKIVVFATYYQQLLVQTVPGLPLDKLNRWNDFILCIEMVFFSAIHMRAFHWSEFENNDASSMFQSMRDATNMNDVANDIRHSFGPKYNNYAMADGPNSNGNGSPSRGGGSGASAGNGGMDSSGGNNKPPPRKLSGDNDMLSGDLDYEPPAQNESQATEVEVVVDDNSPL